MKIRLLFLLGLMVVSGCLSSDLSRSSNFKSHMKKGLTIQRICYAYKSEYMKSIMWGGWTEVLRISDEMPQMSWVKIPVGTPIRITRIERRNLIDHGIEILAFGIIRLPDSDRDTEFLYELTVGLGEQIRRAPWEDISVPAYRITKKKEANQQPDPTRMDA